MGKIDQAIKLIKQIAADNSHGYDQSNRWGPNYDCSSLIITVWETVGVPVKSRGASYTGNMLGVFQSCGFKIVSKSNLQPGDVLLNVANHTAMYIGNGKMVHASLNEKGTISGGQSGDQNSKEICETNYYDYPWDYVLRYQEETQQQSTFQEKKATTEIEIKIPQLSIGTRGPEVKAMQLLLIGHGHSCGNCGADGDFGNDTAQALKVFQTKNNLEVDGICGKNTWSKLIHS